MADANDSGFRFSPRENRAGEIDWLTWGEEAFRRSREEGKPVLLSVSAFWCQWCHVMDETTYSDAQVIEMVNRDYIPVRIDGDRRPDIDSRYNQGGWPTTAFLNHEGEIIAGTTFVPADQFCRLLADVTKVYRESAAEIEAALKLVRERRAAVPGAPEGQPDASMVEFVTGLAEEGFDAGHGGFGTEPKFPYASVLELLLARLAADAPGNLGEILRTTLGQMASGGIRDRVEGGFFRYAGGRDWSEPHYEKLLDDNAALLALYAGAYGFTADAAYAEVAYEAAGYLTSVLLDPQTGAFGGSQDADGNYFRLDEEGRKSRQAPLVDNTVYSGQNAHAASALLKCFQVLGDEEFRGRALAVLDFIFLRMWDDEAGPYHYLESEPRLPGMLSDAARMASAALDAYESGAGEIWLDRSLRVAGWMLERLEDAGGGAFFDCLIPPGAEGLPAERSKPLIENGLAAQALVRLAQNTGQTRFGEAARRTIMCLAGSFQEQGLFAAEYALAVARLLDPPVRITITGAPGDPATAAMIRAAHRARIPFRSVEVIDPEVYGEDLEESGYGYRGRPVAYICIGASCQPQVLDPDELPGRLEAGWSAATGDWGAPAGP